MVLAKKWSFFQLLFLGKIGQENVFYDTVERKNAFLCYKNNKFKKSKNWHFSKGVNPLFWSKNGHFSNFFFRQYRPGKGLLQYWRTKKRLSRLQKQDLQKVEKLTFLQTGQPRVLVQKMALFRLFFLGNIGQENVFYDIFLKKLTHGFGPKMAIYPTFFFRQYRPGKCLLWYSRTKKRLSRL